MASFEHGEADDFIFMITLVISAHDGVSKLKFIVASYHSVTCKNNQNNTKTAIVIVIKKTICDNNGITKGNRKTLKTMMIHFKC